MRTKSLLEKRAETCIQNKDKEIKTLKEKIDKLEKQIKALRGFSNDIIDNDINADPLYIYDSAMRWELLNDDDSKTVTLIGAKNER